MCGIVGILGADKASSELYNGMFAIQHRGQNGAGMYVSDGKDASLEKGPGLVSDVFNKETLEGLEGEDGLGHVRYPTIGSEGGRDAQPFRVDDPLEMGMVHNGNIVNFDRLEEEGDMDLKSRCDLELILNVFSDELKKEGDTDEKALFSAVGRTMDRLNGGYSVVTLIPDIGMLLFRDPHGIRPMIMGKKLTLDGAGFAVASENIVLDILGYDIVRDVKPGEAILIRNDKTVETRQLRPNMPRHCMFEWVYFARTDSTIERRNVYESRLELGEQLAEQWRKNKHSLDVVIPVPDTARTYALAFAEALDIPYREGLLRNRYVGRTFIMPDQTSRETGVRTKLNPIIEEIKDKSVALVDDSIVRGTTSKELVEVVRKAGANEVHFLVGAPPIVSPCYYGIDMPTKKELKASNNSIKKIEKEIGCDSLTYQTIEGLVEGLRINKDHLCLACLNEDYPTQVREDIREYFGEKRSDERESDEKGNGS